MFLKEELEKRKLEKIASKVKKANQEILQKEEEIGEAVVEYIKDGKSQKETIESLVEIARITKRRLTQIVQEEFFKDKYKLSQVIKHPELDNVKKYIKEKKLSLEDSINLLKEESFKEEVSNHFKKKSEEAEKVSLKKHTFYTNEDTEVLLDTCKYIFGKMTGKEEELKTSDLVNGMLINFYETNKEYLEEESSSK
ncbi:hypothetical protein HOK00_03010 [bacterium]|nr:hypothetical protein [bacterium]